MDQACYPIWARNGALYEPGTVPHMGQALCPIQTRLRAPHGPHGARRARPCHEAMEGAGPTRRGCGEVGSGLIPLGKGGQRDVLGAVGFTAIPYGMFREILLTRRLRQH